MQEASSKNFRRPRNFDIEEMQTSSTEEEKNVVNAGVVETWDPLKLAQIVEKSKIRPYITGLVMFIWVSWTIAGLTRCWIAGDTSLLISSPLWLIPIHKVLKFYFG